MIAQPKRQSRPSRPCRRFVRLSQHSRACTRRKPEDRTLRRCTGALAENIGTGRDGRRKSRLRQMREHAETGKIERFWTPRRESGEKAGENPGAFLRRADHFCPQCGQFRGMKMALFCGCQKWNDAVISQKPKKASKIKDNFDAITISGGFDHENRRKKPPHRLDG